MACEIPKLPKSPYARNSLAKKSKRSYTKAHKQNQKPFQIARDEVLTDPKLLEEMIDMTLKQRIEYINNHPDLKMYSVRG